MSKTTWVIVAAVVVIALVAVLAIGSSGGGDRDPDARYNYDVELCDSFVNVYGTVEKPYTGMQYAIIKIRACNDHMSNGLSTNLYVWQWKVRAGDVIYSTNFDMYAHPLYKDELIASGGSDIFAYVYQIPKELHKEDLTILQTYAKSGYKVVQDTSIVV